MKLLACQELDNCFVGNIANIFVHGWSLPQPNTQRFFQLSASAILNLRWRVPFVLLKSWIFFFSKVSTTSWKFAKHFYSVCIKETTLILSNLEHPCLQLFTNASPRLKNFHHISAIFQILSVLGTWFSISPPSKRHSCTPGKHRLRAAHP